MIPRGTLDIGWRDILFGVWSCVRQKPQEQAQKEVEAAWSKKKDCLACFSVRSGFDALLQALNFPRGSEVLVSAITIQEMIEILEHHGLIAIPIDLDIETLSISETDLSKAIGPQTKAILIAHLFGSRMKMEGLVQVAKNHGLILLEDCAQAYVGLSFHGHPDSDVSLFSFGPIKTSTAFGGAILQFKNLALGEKVRRIQANYPRQPWLKYLQRLGWFTFLKFLSFPVLYRGFVIMARLFGSNHDQVLTRATRGFPGLDLIGQIRKQPCSPLLQLLERRIRQDISKTIFRRIRYVQQVLSAFPRISQPGQQAHDHAHWIFPIRTPQPETLMTILWNHGFDATQGASTLYIVPSPKSKPGLKVKNSLELMKYILYVPMWPWLSSKIGNDLDSLFLTSKWI